MDLFEKIEMFEKLATSLLEEDTESNNENKDDSYNHIERRNSICTRLRKLAALRK